MLIPRGKRQAASASAGLISGQPMLKRSHLVVKFPRLVKQT